GVTTWDGVRNYEARNNLRAMKKGDLLLFYHSNEGKEMVGLARVKRAAYQDPKTDDDWSAVDVVPVKRLKRPVTLAQVKAHPELSRMALVKRSRISVVPVTDQELSLVLALAQTKA
ncbi:MAG TPA: EVE domain-containing protein, partial [Labilithrix sp.]|nr:EVE domain-containing protein [Labilithrix sp.]